MTTLAPMPLRTPEPDPVSVRVCRLEDLTVGLGRAFVIRGHEVAVFRTRRGQARAYANRCPHRGGPLADGMLTGDQVVCPLHFFRFELDTGECDRPGTCAIDAYAASIDDDGWVVMELPLPL